MMSNKKAGIFSSFLWRLFELIGSQGVSFIVSIILARKLSPTDYGTVAIVSVIISIVDVFATKGFGAALIQKKDADDVDFSTVFFFNIVFSVILYMLMFVGAPFIAVFYDNQEISMLIRVLSIRVLFSGVNSVQQAYIARRMEFKKFFFATFGGTLLSAVVGIAMAYRGFGAWALVLQYLTNVVVDTIVLWIMSGWRPIRAFSYRKLKNLFQYGWKILCAALLGTIYNNVQSVIIGKRYSSADLAYYSKGKQLPQTIISNVSTAMEGVMFPAMANAQVDPLEIKQIARKSISMSAFIIFPLALGLFATAESVIIFLFTEKWCDAIPLLKCACFIYILWPIQTVALQVIKARGRSDLFLRLEIYKKVIGLSGVVVGMYWGVWGIVIAETMASIVSAIVDVVFAGKLISYSWKEQIEDIRISLAGACIMAIVVMAVGNILRASLLITLLIQVLCGIITYFVWSLLFSNPCVQVFLNAVSSLRGVKKKNS